MASIQLCELQRCWRSWSSDGRSRGTSAGLPRRRSFAGWTLRPQVPSGS